jgi:hypothetical protein
MLPTTPIDLKPNLKNKIKLLGTIQDNDIYNEKNEIVFRVFFHLSEFQ